MNGRPPASWPFIAVCLVALVYSVVFAYPRHWIRGVMGPDEAWHADLARNVLEGEGYRSTTMYPMDALRYDSFPVPEPLKQSGYSLLVAGAWWVTSISWRVMIAVALLAYALGVGLVFLLARGALHSTTAGLIVAGLCLFNPEIVGLNTLPLPTSTFFCLFALFLLLLLHPTLPRVLGAAACFAVLMLVKGYAMLYIPVAAAYVAWMRWQDSSGGGRRTRDHGGGLALR